MKKTIKLLIILVFICTSLPVNAEATPAIKNIKQSQKLYTDALTLREKADNLEKIGEKTSADIFRREASQKLHEAIGLLAHVLGENPRDEIALFTLGTIYFQTGNWDKAREKFAQCAVSEKMRQAVYGFYKVESNRLAGDDNITQSLRLLRQACFFRPQDPDIQAELKEMAKTYFSQGVNFLNMSQIQGAYEYFLTATALDETYSLPCAQKIIEKASSLDDDPVEQIRLSAQALELDSDIHDQAIEVAKKACENAKATGNENTINLVKTNLKSFGQQDYSFVVATVWPPKSWKTVYKKIFVGVGHTGGDDPDNDGSIYTAVSGKDIFVGYRYTVIDSNFEVWYEGAWKKFDKGAWLPVVKIKTGNKLTFRNEKGKKFTVVVQKYF